MLDLSFSVEGQDVVHRRLGIVADGVKSYKKPFDQIGLNLLKVFDINFSSRGALYGGWKPRKPQYLAGGRIDDWPLLERTGRMRHSFEKDVNDTSLILHNDVPYFVYHQSNAPRTSNLPRRVMMSLRQQEAQMIVKEVQLYLIRLLGSGSQS